MRQTNINAQHSTLQFNLYKRLQYIYEDQDNIDYRSGISKRISICSRDLINILIIFNISDRTRLFVIKKNNKR